MAKPASRQQLIDYCKRQLGYPVLEINVADEQIEDLVDDAIQLFNERHFDDKLYSSIRTFHFSSTNNYVKILFKKADQISNAGICR